MVSLKPPVGRAAEWGLQGHPDESIPVRKDKALHVEGLQPSMDPGIITCILLEADHPSMMLRNIA